MRKNQVPLFTETDHIVDNNRIMNITCVDLAAGFVQCR